MNSNWQFTYVLWRPKFSTMRKFFFNEELFWSYLIPIKIISAFKASANICGTSGYQCGFSSFADFTNIIFINYNFVSRSWSNFQSIEVFALNALDVENLLPSMVSSDKQFPAFQPRMLDKQARSTGQKRRVYVKSLFTYDFLLSVSVF